MSYYDKYIKYKNKYIDLQNKIKLTGGTEADEYIKNIVDQKNCNKNYEFKITDEPLKPTLSIFDLECIDVKIDEKSQLSFDTITAIREGIQNYYSQFYSFLCSKSVVLHYGIPIIDTPEYNKQGVVDFDKLITAIGNFINNKIDKKNFVLVMNKTSGKMSFNTQEEANNYQNTSQILGSELLLNLNRIFITKDISQMKDFDTFINSSDLITILKKLLLYKKILFVYNVLEQLKASSKIVVEIGLSLFRNLNTLKNEGHANSLVIYKIGDKIYVIRTEPHRHTNIYCRNSVRKAIREIFLFTDDEIQIINDWTNGKYPWNDNFDGTELLKLRGNFFYRDYVINSKNKTGLQLFEEQIDLINSNDYSSLEPKYKIQSPLKGNSGFCASWTMYTTLILLLNIGRPLEEIGDYLGTFGLNSIKSSTSNTLLDPVYTLYKHIKLYRAILLVVAFIKNELGEIEYNKLISQLKSDEQVKINKIIKDIQYNAFKTQLTTLQNVNIPEPIDFDPHYCSDSVFEHIEFCQENVLEKEINNNRIGLYKCSTNKITLPPSIKKKKGLTITITMDNKSEAYDSVDLINKLKNGTISLVNKAYSTSFQASDISDDQYNQLLNEYTKTVKSQSGTVNNQPTSGVHVTIIIDNESKTYDLLDLVNKLKNKDISLVNKAYSMGFSASGITQDEMNKQIQQLKSVISNQ